MQKLLFKFSKNISYHKLNRITLFNFVAITTLMLQGVAHCADARDNWIQYPPRAAVNMTEQINKFKEMGAEKERGSEAGVMKEKEKETQSIKSEKSNLSEQPAPKEVKKTKTLISEDVSWEKDHKTKNIVKKFSDGTTDTQTDVVEPIAGEPFYKGNLEMIPMTYADGVKSIITRKANSEEYEWGKDHSTRTTIYKFSDGTTNIDIKSFPRKYSQPEFKDGFEKITVTYPDGTQRVVENEAIDRKVRWSKDHLTQIITYIFDDGKSYEESIDVPKKVEKPIYEADQQKTVITYGDGFKEEVISKAVDEKVSWSTDHLRKKILYTFADGGTTSVEVQVPRKASNPIYKDNLQTIYFTYGDGVKTVLVSKAISENVSWSVDHLVKTTEYIFADATVNKVVVSVAEEVSKPVYNKDTQIITTKYGDGTVTNVVNKAMSEDVSWSEDHLYKTISYQFSDGSTNQVVVSIPNQILPPTYKMGVESIKKIYGDGFEKVFTYEAISQKEVWSSDHESKVILYKFADGTTHKEEIKAPKIYGKPYYDNDTQIIPVHYADGTTRTIRKKAVEKKVILGGDEQTKMNRFVFEDGSVNDVPLLLAPAALGSSTQTVQSPQPAQTAKTSQADKASDKKPDAKFEIQKPVYLQGLQIVTMTASNGKTQTATNKAISKDETWSKDGKTKSTTYRFEDGTTNTVITDVGAQMSKQPKPTSNPVDDELNVHSLADE